MSRKAVLASLHEAAANGLSVSLPCFGILESLAMDGRMLDLHMSQASGVLTVVLADDPAVGYVGQHCGNENVRAVKRWRKPDATHGRLATAIWYGPRGEDGDEATMVERLGGSNFMVSEYQSIEGLLDDYDYDPQETILRSTTTISLPFTRLCPLMALRVAADIGIERLHMDGGLDERVSAIP